MRVHKVHIMWTTVNQHGMWLTACIIIDHACYVTYSICYFSFAAHVPFQHLKLVCEAWPGSQVMAWSVICYRAGKMNTEISAWEC